MCDPTGAPHVLEVQANNTMLSFWHITAVCCVPKLNPERRAREQEIFRDVAADSSRRVVKGATRIRGRWERRELALAGKD